MRQFFAVGFLLLVVCYSAGAAVDLAEISVGAKPLSLGKAFAGGIDDASSIFTNPAGLALSSGVKAVSMNGSLLSDVNYLLLGAANDSPIGEVGIGYVVAFIPSIPLTTVEGSGANLTVTQTGQTDYSSSMIYLSYATKLSRILQGKLENVAIGGNLKYFFQGFSGGGSVMQDAAGVGADADFGLLLKLNPWARFGLIFNNFLPLSFGGKFTWQKNNVVETIPWNMRAGGTFSILGKTALRQSEDQELNLFIDYEMPGTANWSRLWHGGLEYKPLEVLSLRAGVDQKAKAAETGIGVDNNLTAGVGINFNNFAFDYAYHQFGELSENTTHFFSIGYRENIEPGRRREGESVKSVLPAPEVVPKPKLKTFTDLAEDYWAKKPIEYLATLGIMGGYPDHTFRPEKVLTRGELAVILVKAKEFETKPVGESAFKDVAAGDWLAPFIDVVVRRRYMSGYPDGAFRPQKKITRAEAAVIFAKVSGLYVKEKVQQQVFPDLEKSHWASPAIAASKQMGFFEYLSDKNFEPFQYLTRAEAAEILSKTPFVKDRIKQLIAGEK